MLRREPGAFPSCRPRRWRGYSRLPQIYLRLSSVLNLLTLPFPRKQLPNPPNDSKLLPPNKAAPISVITNQRAANKHQTKMSLILKTLCLILAAAAVDLWRSSTESCDSYPVFTPSLQNLLPTAMQYNRT